MPGKTGHFDFFGFSFFINLNYNFIMTPISLNPYQAFI